jgi:hypothetical protein
MAKSVKKILAYQQGILSLLMPQTWQTMDDIMISLHGKKDNSFYHALEDLTACGRIEWLGNKARLSGI